MRDTVCLADVGKKHDPLAVGNGRLNRLTKWALVLIPKPKIWLQKPRNPNMEKSKTHEGVQEEEKRRSKKNENENRAKEAEFLDPNNRTSELIRGNWKNWKA
ncbi:hypothetical protein CIPAW_08G060200 [Carya illinoinensis]|uniref:Uncharacterized protein n=1 Tax=Carya illinoinensis TaxID=32201 RepID=A0A8T1PUG4_CARIL|nr:hypothetical protein CIPAW_08G060200 [Carya illinoinensis]